MLHKIKIRESYWNAVEDGRKTFEVRDNDRGYNAGDLIQFEVVSDSGVYMRTESQEYLITYVLNCRGIDDGYVVFAFIPK